MTKEELQALRKECDEICRNHVENILGVCLPSDSDIREVVEKYKEK